eukprot:1130926-Prorocentrum_minimum.AAC.1
MILLTFEWVRELCGCRMAWGVQQQEVLMLVCGHQFHKGCIREWLAGKRVGSCPLCKREL